MRRGILEIRGNLRSLLVYGLSYQSLWWQDGVEKPTPVLDPRKPVDAFRCDRCRTLVLPPPAPPAPPAIFRRIPNELARTVFRTRPRRKRGP